MSDEIDDFVVDSSSVDAAGTPPPAASVAVSGDASPDSVSPAAQAPSDDDDLTTTETPEPSDAERTPDGKFAKKGSIQERIDKATREKHDATRRADALAARVAELERQHAAPVAPTTPESTAAAALADRPKIDAFDNYEEWVEAVAEWKADQKWQAHQAKATEEHARQQHAETMRAHTGRVQAFAAATPDYFDVIAKSGDLPLSAAMQEVLVTSAQGPALAYYLATHREEATSLLQQTQGLPITAASLVRQLLESKLSASSTASSGPVVGGVHRSVPAPIKPVGSAPVVTDTPLDELDVDAFVARENARERAERKGRLAVK